jgi:hypothetical protein
MPSESLDDAPTPGDTVGSVEQASDSAAPETRTDLPGELSEFSQRLASFGLGEAPDPLLTEAGPPSKRRPRR